MATLKLGEIEDDKPVKLITPVLKEFMATDRAFANCDAAVRRLRSAKDSVRREPSRNS
jgi:hypothetical protein